MIHQISEFPRVTILHNSPIWPTVYAIRKCWASEGKSDSYFRWEDPAKHMIETRPLESFSEIPEDACFFMGEKDIALVKKAIQKGHTSPLEHLSYTFEVNGISRGCLQELARHRIASLSVQSSRYALKKLVNGASALTDLLVSSGNEEADHIAEVQLEMVRRLYNKRQDLKNDVAKYMIPEALTTELVWTINARSLMNFLALRTNRAAHFEIRRLAMSVFNAIPSQHRAVIFEDVVYGVDSEE